MPMGDWKSKTFEKLKKGSHTPGRAKGATCQADAQKKFINCHPHAHRLEPAAYAAALEKSKRAI